VHNCAAFRRELWRLAGGIDEYMPRWMDHEFWIRVAAQGARIEPLHGEHFFYRRHESSLSRSTAPRVWRKQVDWTSEEVV
jgi:surfactin synthase thioesterase subunit